mgnify:CR=1 FL=1
MELQEQKCPLCDQASTYTSEDHSDKKYFICQRCKHFVISIRAETRINRDSAKPWKDALSMESSTLGDNDLLFIFVPTKEKEDGITTSTAVDREKRLRANWWC